MSAVLGGFLRIRRYCVFVHFADSIQRGYPYNIVYIFNKNLQ